MFKFAKHPVWRRPGTLLSLAVLLVLALAGAACAPAAVPTSAPPTAAPSAPTSAPQATLAPAATSAPQPTDAPSAGGKTLTVAIPGDIGTMDIQGGIGISAAPLFAVYNGLLGFSPDMKLIPLLAESWQVVDDTTYRYKLRQGIKFHSGNPFNAEAVKADIERFLEPGVAARPYNLLDMIDKVEVEDEYTVLFKLKRPYPAFPFHTAEIIAMIVDAKKANEVGAEQFAQNPSGTGAFILSEWVKNDHMTLKRNPDYWEKGKPCIDTLIYKVIPEESTRIVALEAGEVDVVFGVGPADVARLKENPNIKIDDAVVSRSVYMGFQYDTEPFTDLRVRQALWHAVDAQSIVDFAQEGFGEKATTFYPSFIFGSAEGKIKAALDYDPEKAKALLDEAGWVAGADGIRAKDGKRFSVTLSFPTAVLPAMKQTAEVIQQNLKDVGIEVNLNALDWPAFIGDWIGKKQQMYLMGVSATTGSLDVSFPNQWTTDGVWNASRYSNPKIDQLFAEASKTVDDAKRAEMYQELQQILAEDVAAVPLFNMKTAIAMNKKVQGVENHPVEHGYIQNACIE